MAHCSECSATLPGGVAACPTCGAPVTQVLREDPEGGPHPGQDAARLHDELAAALAPRYELLRELGQGGMGLVYLAREPALKRLVAVKLLAPDLAGDHAARARFEREARAAAALSHPNVVRVYAVGETTQLRLPYIVMQYVEGTTLADLMAERGRLAERDARRIIGEVAAALAAAHARELVHRDVKPSNVLIEAESQRAYVADFGVSAALSPSVRAEQTRLTATGMMVGTPVYMSPEQASAGDVGPASDVYSLGVLGYELLVGEPPFRAATAMGWAAAHLRDTPTPVANRRTDVAPEVALLVDRCLAKEPGRRPTAGEVARGMLPTLESELPWPPPGLHGLLGRGRILTRLSLLLAGAGAAVALLLAYPPQLLFARGPWLQWFSTQGQTAGAFVQSDRAVIQRLDSILGAWQAAVVLAALVFSVTLLGLLAALQRVMSESLRHRISGWRWKTLLDVVADTDGRTGLILAGAREFTSLGAPTRAAVLHSRRIVVAADLLVGMWIALVLVAQVGVALVTTPAAEVAPSIAPWVAWLAILPATGALAVAVGARLIHRVSLGPLARREAFAADVRAVTAWYEAVPDRPAPQPMPRLASRLVRAGVVTVLTVVAGFSLAASAVAGFGAVVALQNARWVGPLTTTLLQDAERYRSEDRGATLARLMRPYMPVTQPASDSEVRAWLSALSSRSGAPDNIAMQRFVSRMFPWRGRTPTSDSLFRQVFQQRVGRDTIALLAASANLPRLGLLQQLAHADTIDLVAVGFGPLDSHTSFDEIAWPAWFNPLADASLANVIAAMGDVARRDYVGAERRFGENFRVWQEVRLTPMWWISSTHLRRSSLFPLAKLERFRGNAALADSLDAAAEPLSIRLEGAAGLGTDIGHLATLRGLVADERLPGYVRLDLVKLAFYGFCTNPREAAFGPSRERRDTLLALAKSLPNVPHVAELAELMARGWDRLTARSVRGLVRRAELCGLRFRQG